jgi:multisubunit Na+/H+ antiporter MnhB subunit
MLRLVIPSALIALGVTGVARAQSSELASIFEIDPAVALNGFALFAGAIVLLFEAYRSRP